ncbi:appetite-regulating hormone-like [Eubalaena glacialis]|uniref:appetite-regulating hormone-like n=1 Tax=Eubalaena glacialis TaxID=27606 RepID=UPI002A5A8EF7|nr:appetite-regulating hormone-like [Eubalaena glacialis]
MTILQSELLCETCNINERVKPAVTQCRLLKQFKRAKNSKELKMADKTGNPLPIQGPDGQRAAALPGISDPSVPSQPRPRPPRGTVCSLLLLTVVWVDLTMAGSSFLSPKPQNVQQRQEPAERAWTRKHKKASAKLKARALEGWLSPEVRSQVEGAENELEIRFNTLFDVGIKLSGAQFHQHSQTLGKFLQEVLWEEANEASG